MAEGNKKYEPSNPRLYLIAPGEPEKKRKKRLDKIEKDIKDRMQILVQETGARGFPIDPHKLEQKAIIRILEKKGLVSQDEVEDMYHMIVDEKVQDLESRKDEIKKQVDEQRVARFKGISVPRDSKPKKGIIRA